MSLTKFGFEFLNCSSYSSLYASLLAVKVYESFSANSVIFEKYLLISDGSVRLNLVINEMLFGFVISISIIS